MATVAEWIDRREVGADSLKLSAAMAERQPDGAKP